MNKNKIIIIRVPLLLLASKGSLLLLLYLAYTTFKNLARLLGGSFRTSIRRLDLGVLSRGELWKPLLALSRAATASSILAPL